MNFCIQRSIQPVISRKAKNVKFDFDFWTNCIRSNFINFQSEQQMNKLKNKDKRIKEYSKQLHFQYKPQVNSLLSQS